MAELLFGFPCVRQRRTRIYRFNDSILTYSNQKLLTRYRFGKASIEYNTNLIEADLQRKTNCYYVLRPIDQVLIAIQFYASGGLLQVQSIAGAILELIIVLTHGKLHYGIFVADITRALIG